MQPYDESRDDTTDDDIDNSTGGALFAAEGYVASSADPSRSCDGGREAFSSTFKALCCWGEDFALIRPSADFEFLRRPPDAYGNEHEAWFIEDTGLWFKATYEDKFGLAWGREGTANPREYLTRLTLQNTYFGDEIELVALVRTNRNRLRILTSQPHIAGEAARSDEIHQWFTFLGFVRVESNGSIAWYSSSENLLIADAHEGNVIRVPLMASPDNRVLLIPIDLNIVQPNGKLLEWVNAQIQAKL